jgi:hypothetical protein
LLTTWRVLRGSQSKLVRRGDRIDAALRVSFVPLLLLVAVGAALAALALFHTGQAREHTQLQSMQRVSSTVVSVTGLTTAGPVDPATTAAWQVRLKWRTDVGTTRTASLVTLSEPKPGDAMTLWLDRSGRPVPALWTASDSRDTAALSGLGLLVFGTTLIGAAIGLVRRMLTRQRLAEWSAEWERVAPTWTNR